MSRGAIFVVGCPRSGTTLVGRLLNAHPRLAIFHETHFYDVIGPETRFYGPLERDGELRRLVADVVAMLRRRALLNPIVESLTIDGLLREVIERTPGGVLAAALRLNAASQGKPRYGDKTPEHVFHLSPIWSDFPEAQVVLVVRDPRDTALSARAMFLESLAASAWRWRRAFQAARSHWERLVLVRYEDLVAQPQAELERLCGALGEAFDPGMLRFYEATPVNLPHHPLLRASVTSQRVGRWRSAVADDVAIVEDICAEGMETLGYPRSTPVRRERSAPGPPGAVRSLVSRVRFYLSSGLRARNWVEHTRIRLTNRARHLGRLGTP